MAFEDVTPDMDMSSRYWEPQEIGDNIEGNICNWEMDNWGNTRICLEIEGGFEKVLPAHKDLLRYNSKLEIGDYIKVTLSKIKKSNNPEYNDQKLYKVQKDPSRKVEYEEEDDGFDDYY